MNKTRNGITAYQRRDGAESDIYLCVNSGFRVNYYIVLDDCNDVAALYPARRKQKWSVDPRNSAWSKDDSKFGQKMLERMGWSKGKVSAKMDLYCFRQGQQW